MTESVQKEQQQEQQLKIVIDTISEISQQAQFAAINIAIAANRVSKDYGKDSELGKTLEQLAAQVSDATKRIDSISKVAVEGLNYFDHKSLTYKAEIEPGTLKKLEESFAIILSSSKKVMDMLKRLRPVQH